MRNVSQQFPQLETEICTTVSIDQGTRHVSEGKRERTGAIKVPIANRSTTTTTTTTTRTRTRTTRTTSRTIIVRDRRGSISPATNLPLPEVSTSIHKHLPTSGIDW
ncbi:hypothetical protein HZH66_007109 [Vespula vulgaris]|uniref:Uncharacterized protein n=1 Tax=Vespula vulgaris TaxID=7454 RepID=A0A834JXH8_VESVU|nr:hypothetical protein HZH66_007109 [Vespula vulgaris]